MPRRPNRARRARTVEPFVIAVLAVSSVVAVVALGSSRAGSSMPRSRPAARRSALSGPADPSAPTAARPATTAATDAPADPADTAARARLAALVAQGPAGGVSVAATDLSTGASVSAGAGGGMITASIIKVELLESLLWQDERQHTTMTTGQDQVATTMIENSDNDSAEDIFEDVGGRSAVVADEAPLGLSTTVTVPGTGDYWGLTTTDASQQLVLLRNLVAGGSPLDPTDQAYVLGLMRAVESDQRWGVGVAADAGTDFANKDGWLSVDDDDERWAVNSDGVITVGGHTVLVSVLTQHDTDEAGGITLVQTLSRAAVAALGDGS